MKITNKTSVDLKDFILKFNQNYYGINLEDALPATLFLAPGASVV